MKNKLYEKYGVGAMALLLCFTILVFGVFPNMFKLISQNVSGNYISTTACIGEIKTKRVRTSYRHEVYVRFNANGKIVYEKLDTYVEGMREGDEVEILYNKTQPQEVTLKFNRIMQLLLFSFVSLFFGLIGIYLIKKRVNKTKFEQTTRYKMY